MVKIFRVAENILVLVGAYLTICLTEVDQIGIQYTSAILPGKGDVLSKAFAGQCRAGVGRLRDMERGVEFDRRA